ncbi:hypothetical protein PspLS_10145 [Pyricularia sp. CBS 133598]|nr:hypothetical protein PspLS_10145 [Pyricularia sp. CBS 133598]
MRWLGREKRWAAVGEVEMSGTASCMPIAYQYVSVAVHPAALDAVFSSPAGGVGGAADEDGAAPASAAGGDAVPGWWMNDRKCEHRVAAPGQPLAGTMWQSKTSIFDMLGGTT